MALATNQETHNWKEDVGSNPIMSKLIYYKKLTSIYHHSIVSTKRSEEGSYLIILSAEEIFEKDFIQSGSDQSWNRKVRYLRAYLKKHPEELI